MGYAPRILVIDDEPGVQLFLEQVLSNVGYYVTLAANGRQALAQVRSREFDAVIIDLSLPDQDGMEVMRQIRSEFPRLLSWLSPDTWWETCRPRPKPQGPQTRCENRSHRKHCSCKCMD